MTSNNAKIIKHSTHAIDDMLYELRVIDTNINFSRIDTVVINISSRTQLSYTHKLQIHKYILENNNITNSIYEQYIFKKYKSLIF